MGEKGQISHAEDFQTIYVDTPPSRRWNITPRSLNVGCAELLPSKEYSMGCGGVTLQWRNLTNTTSVR